MVSEWKIQRTGGAVATPEKGKRHKKKKEKMQQVGVVGTMAHF